MKFSSAAITLFVTSAAVSARTPRIATGNSTTDNFSSASEASQDPHPKDSGSFKPKSFPDQNNKVAGAAYFITNQPEGNFIVCSDVGPDGRLAFKGAISAGGRGAHGHATPIGPDPFFSQGAIKVAGESVFTINAGSDTIVMFSISKNDPAKLKMVGQPVNTGGEFPVSVAISKQSGQVCVLNGGKVNGINCFKQDPKLGLIQMDDTQRALNLNQTTPATGPPGSVSQVVFNEDGSRLLVSVKGVAPVPGFIAMWDVDAKSGALSSSFTKVTAEAPGLLPFSMTLIPGKNAVLATDPGVGFDIFDFENGKNASSSIFPIEGQKATCWSSFSSKTGNFYLTDVGTATVTEVNVDDQLKGRIVKQYPQGNGSATIDNDVATINNKDFLYVMAANATSVIIMSLDAPGQARHVQQFDFAAEAKRAGVVIDAFNLQGMAVFVNK